MGAPDRVFVAGCMTSSDKYAQLRFEAARGLTTEDDLDRTLTESDQIHWEMTQLVTRSLGNGTPIVMSLIITLNAVFRAVRIREIPSATSRDRSGL